MDQLSHLTNSNKSSKKGGKLSHQQPTSSANPRPATSKGRKLTTQTDNIFTAAAKPVAPARGRQGSPPGAGSFFNKRTDPNADSFEGSGSFDKNKNSVGASNSGNDFFDPLGLG